jgi:hypothetical protein
MSVPASLFNLPGAQHSCPPREVQGEIAVLRKIPVTKYQNLHEHQGRFLKNGQGILGRAVWE